MDPLGAQDVLDHYRRVAGTVAAHLRGRPVRTGGWSVSGGMTAVADQAGVLDLIGAGARWLSVPAGALAGRSVLRLTAGPGADLATIATAALALTEAAGLRGAATVVLTDGEEGMYAVFDGTDTVDACVADLVDRAPEVATADPAADEGRVLLRRLADEEFLPAPYSLVDTAEGTGVVLPLHVDEIAAAAAGMPIEPEPSDATDRLADRGDLAAGLVGQPPPPA